MKTALLHVFAWIGIVIVALTGIFLITYDPPTHTMGPPPTKTTLPNARTSLPTFTPVPVSTRVIESRRAEVTPIPQATKRLPTATSIPPTFTPVPPTPTAVQASLSGSGHINVRTGPGTNYEVAQRLTPHKTYRVVGRNQDWTWWEIDIDDESPLYKTGWVLAELVGISGANGVRLADRIPPTPSPIPVLGYIDYRELFRNINQYRGESFQFRGLVWQVEEHYGDYYLMVSVTYDGLFWDDHVRLNYYDSRTRILEKDVIEFVGEVNGIYRYQTVRGDIRDIPELYAHELRVVQ